MKRFSIEVFVFTLILLLTIKVIKSSVPFYWGNKLMNQKIEYIQNSDQAYNSFFIGSSKTMRHINPILFEKKTGKASFNLGCSGMFALETEYMIDNLSKTKSFQSTENVYVQHIDYMEISEENLHSLRVNYYMDSKRLKRALKYYLSQGDYEQSYFHLSSYIENQLCIGQFLKIYDYNTTKINPLSGLVAKQNGFYSLDQDLKIGKGKQLQERRQSYLKSVKANKHVKINPEDIEIKELDTDEMFGFQFPSENTKLWQIENNPISNHKYYFDRAHYNEEGANIFTTLVSEAVNKKN